MMTSAQVVETSVNVTLNSPSQDYTHPDDHNLPNYERIHWKKFLQNLISSAFGSQFCSSRVFRAKYMLDTDHQGVASEIMSFSRLITNARAKADF